MNSYIVRYKGTPPNHYDAPKPVIVTSFTKEEAIVLAKLGAELGGMKVSSVRRYFGTHDSSSNLVATEAAINQPARLI